MLVATAGPIFYLDHTCFEHSSPTNDGLERLQFLAVAAIGALSTWPLPRTSKGWIGASEIRSRPPPTAARKSSI